MINGLTPFFRGGGCDILLPSSFVWERKLVGRMGKEEERREKRASSTFKEETRREQEQIVSQ